MMKNNSYLIICTLFICFTFCTKKNATNINTGILFQPLKSNGIEITSIGAIAINDNSVKLACFDSNLSVFSGFYTYNILTKSLIGEKNTHNHDSMLLVTIQGATNGNYIGLALDKRFPYIVNSKEYNYYKLLQLDRNLNTRKQAVIPDTVMAYWFITGLTNGDFILVYNKDVVGMEMIMLCFDADLSIKWRTKLPFESISSFCVSENSISFLENMNGSNAYYKVHQFNYQGKFIKTVSSPFFNYTPHIAPSKDGFTVFSTLDNSIHRSQLSIARYDKNADLIGSTILDTKTFSFIDPSGFALCSDIEDVGDSYYFEIYCQSALTTNLDYGEAKLVKLNKNQEIEWVRTIDYSRKLGEYSYLKFTGNSLLNIGQSSWNNIKGLTIFQMDLDGNFIQ